MKSIKKKFSSFDYEFTLVKQVIFFITEKEILIKLLVLGSVKYLVDGPSVGLIKMVSFDSDNLGSKTNHREKIILLQTDGNLY